MINLSNETDYKLIFKTKNLYNFFFILIIILFFGVFFKIINLSVQEKNNQIEIVSEKNSKVKHPDGLEADALMVPIKGELLS